MLRFLRKWRARSRFVRAFQARDWPRAVEAGERLIELKPHDYPLHHNLGFAYLEAGDPSRAESCFRRANELHEHPIHWNNLGRALLQSGRHAEAEAAFRRASELNPLDPQPRYNLAVCLREAGRVAEAADALRSLVRAFPEHAGGHNDLGCVAEQQGDRDRALASYARSVEVAPGYLAARLNLIRLLCASGRHPETTPHLKAVAAGGVRVNVRATDSEVEILLDDQPFYRGPVQNPERPS